jgi:hypothetical protein
MKSLWKLLIATAVAAGALTPPVAAMETALPGWRARYDAVVARVARRERQTYFDERTLAQALRQR